MIRVYFFFFCLLSLISCDSNTTSVSEQSTNPVVNHIPFYIGTYTDGDSKGIYKATLTSDGHLKNRILAVQTEQPSFLAKSAEQPYLVAVNETDKEETKGGTITSYRIEGDSLHFISRQASGGAHPCYVSINTQGDVLVANYTGGNVGYLRLNQNGQLSELLAVEQHTGKGTTARQEAPHAHAVQFLPSGEGIVSVDLGSNELWFSQLQASSIETKFKLNMEAGAGPRHIAFHPNQKWLYVINELNSTVGLILKNAAGAYERGSTASTLPEGFTATNLCADIHISSDGKFLYASNRGHHSIATFQINPQNGSLTSLGYTHVQGEWPRNFALSPDENYVLVANQHTNNVVLFKRDQTSGLLSYLEQMEVPNPVCIVF
ncbi:MAG: lactonase family protein [Flammeovirgaceae bacterium]